MSGWCQADDKLMTSSYQVADTLMPSWWQVDDKVLTKLSTNFWPVVATLPTSCWQGMLLVAQLDRYWQVVGKLASSWWQVGDKLLTSWCQAVCFNFVNLFGNLFGECLVFLLMMLVFLRDFFQENVHSLVSFWDIFVNMFTSWKLLGCVEICFWELLFFIWNRIFGHFWEIFGKYVRKKALTSCFSDLFNSFAKIVIFFGNIVFRK